MVPKKLAQSKENWFEITLGVEPTYIYVAAFSKRYLLRGGPFALRGVEEFFSHWSVVQGNFFRTIRAFFLWLFVLHHFF